LNADAKSDCKLWHERSYGERGFSAQRFYPNEELLRFLGRHYFPLPPERRRDTRILETGCGSGANLWMIAREGFDAHGIDLSAEGIGLCEKMLAHWQTAATLKVADMTAIPYPGGYFDVVLDVFSSYCLGEAGFALFLDEVARLVRAGGRFFSYAPSKASDAFRNPGTARFLDASTLDGIHRDDSAYAGNRYPFRFSTIEEYTAALGERGLRVAECETVSRTYRRGKEYFEFVVITAER
jgi:cyclopropane fatty-acyl-phospholipid synthase-like methyltransferase